MNILFFLHPKAELCVLYGNYTLRQAFEKMTAHRYTVVPIISVDGMYIGTLSEGDILYHLKNHNVLDIEKAEDIMLYSLNRYRSYEAIKINANINDLFGLVIQQNFVPVVDDRNVFIGIITRKDVMKYLIEHQEKEN